MESYLGSENVVLWGEDQVLRLVYQVADLIDFPLAVSVKHLDGVNCQVRPANKSYEVIKVQSKNAKSPCSRAQDCNEAVTCDLHVHHLLSLVFLTEECCVASSQRFKTIILLPETVEIFGDILELDFKCVLDGELLLLQDIHVHHVTQVRMLVKQLPENL